MLGFEIGLRDIVDILFVAVILYEVYRLLKRYGAVNLFWGIFVFLMLWFVVAYVFTLELTGALFDRIVSVGAIALIILFQDELRMFLSRVGATMSIENIQYRFRGNQWRQLQTDKQVAQIVLACRHMSAQKVGALIVVECNQTLDNYMESGERIDSRISARLIENIFFKNSPLHDGALIVQNGRLASAACILPVSKSLSIPQHYGLRHRSALGLAEKTDALVVVVSEQTGLISVAKEDSIRTVTLDELSELLTKNMTK
ncbi:MAG: diadenylate cyclase CdaA [Paludibacteraceae bacterium]|nr:diadenylate cyclase CdaA [Paludibacteraceae bacterium]MBR1785797.1 diadenylate cyclase CdaA [Paludibacteraceae bacterium]